MSNWSQIPPEPSLPAVSSSLDTVTCEQATEDEETPGPVPRSPWNSKQEMREMYRGSGN